MENVNLYELIDALAFSIDLAEPLMDDNCYAEKIYNFKKISQNRFLNHSKRTCYVSMQIAFEISHNKDFLLKTYISSMLHDIGVCSTLSESHRDFCFLKEHSEKGSQLTSKLHLTDDIPDIIKYHHENYDGTGPFNLKGDEIPLISQIIHLADIFDLLYDDFTPNYLQRESILNSILESKNKSFSGKIVDIFENVQSKDYFWWDCDTLHFTSCIDSYLPTKSSVLIPISEIKNIALVFAELIDNKSEFTFTHSKNLSILVGKICDYLNYSPLKKTRFEVAALLHDIGKLAIPNSILHKNTTLTDSEFSIIKSHVYYTRIILSKVSGFDDIIDIASNHHEKLDGTGYPYALKADDLSFDARILAVCDVYDALTSARPYKEGISKDSAFNILDAMVNENKLCSKALKVLKAAVTS